MTSGKLKRFEATEYFFGHIAWLHERFPAAKYEDVTGLCKLASLAEVKPMAFGDDPKKPKLVFAAVRGITGEEGLSRDQDGTK